MGDSKKPKSRKKSKKDSQLVIRVNGDDRDAFIALCEELDTSASREIRRFMKLFVDTRGAAAAAPMPSRLEDAQDDAADNGEDDD